MVQTHGFDRRELHALFAKVRPSQSVARAIARHHGETLARIPAAICRRAAHLGGVQFWNDNAETLARARETFGVPEASSSR